ncbi:discoidin domain-containing protein [Streptomyces sp. NPDC001153]
MPHRHPHRVQQREQQPAHSGPLRQRHRQQHQRGGRPASASSSNSPYVASNLTDSDPSSYWEGTNGSFPQWAQVDLGQSYSIGKVVLKLPPSTAWGARTQTLSLLGSTDGSTFSTIVGSAGYTFDPNTNTNTVTVTFNATTARYVRANITANTGWNAAQLSDFEVFTSGNGSGTVSTDLAAGKATSESSHTQTYASSNVTDGNQSTYWESANNAFPQWVQVDLGSQQSASRVVLQLPAGWGARDQTLSLLGSTDGTTFSTVKASATYTFDPATSNTVTITFPASTQRYFRVNITANTGWPAGQISEFQVWNN